MNGITSTNPRKISEPMFDISNNDDLCVPIVVQEIRQWIMETSAYADSVPTWGENIIKRKT